MDDTEGKYSGSGQQKNSIIQIGGSHYLNQKIQCWDFIAANNLDFFQGNIVKYITRWRNKGGLEDLYKAKHVLEKYIEVNANENQ